MFDAHCHLEDFEDQAKVVDEANKAGVREMLTCGTGLENSRKSVRMAREHEGVWAAVGMGYESSVTDSQFSLFETFVNEQVTDRDNKIVAVGECGLDSGDINVWLFEEHVRLAEEKNLPLVVHCRGMFEKTYAILKSQAKSLKGVQMHCWTGDWEWAKKFLDLGCYLSFGGVLTFKKSDYLREVARQTPRERILVETDAPYLAPEPVRGEWNKPANLRLIVEKLAEIREQSVEEASKFTRENAKSLFGI